MKKLHLLTYLFLFLAFSSPAQSIERQLIGFAGGSNTDDQILLDWTLGEASTELNYALFGYFKEGFLQPDSLGQELTESENENRYTESGQLTASVFPNPFIETFTIQINAAQGFDASFIILDYSGKLLMEKILPAGSVKMDWAMNGLPSGLYFLQFSDNSGVLIQSFKLLKL